VSGGVPSVFVGADEMRAFGGRVAALLRPGDWVALYGELGSGKTTLVSGIVDALHPGTRGRSPTYVLVEVYGERPAIVHADLYRLRTPAEFETLGLRDLAGEDAVVLIEWADRAPDRLPADRLELHLAYAGGNARSVQAVAFGLSWEARLAQASGLGVSRRGDGPRRERA
jgi:tRNA threonylcarbamoyl adenosine modification protein YjeE